MEGQYKKTLKLCVNNYEKTVKLSSRCSSNLYMFFLQYCHSLIVGFNLVLRFFNSSRTYGKNKRVYPFKVDGIESLHVVIPFHTMAPLLKNRASRGTGQWTEEAMVEKHTRAPSKGKASFHRPRRPSLPLRQHTSRRIAQPKPGLAMKVVDRDKSSATGG